jgi:hypothetical protein
LDSYPVCRFYDRQVDYEVEVRMFNIPGVLPTLPKLYASSDNTAGRLRGPEGFVFPPFLVTERGQSLQEWLQVSRDNLLLLAMIRDVAELLATLHAGGHVHRDIKPDNILLMLQTQVWRLIDFGISGPCGTPQNAFLCQFTVLFAGRVSTGVARRCPASWKSCDRSHPTFPSTSEYDHAWPIFRQCKPRV